jgi:hypothetical protein
MNSPYRELFLIMKKSSSRIMVAKNLTKIDESVSGNLQESNISQPVPTTSHTRRKDSDDESFEVLASHDVSFGSYKEDFAPRPNEVLEEIESQVQRSDDIIQITVVIAESDHSCENDLSPLAAFISTTMQSVVVVTRVCYAPVRGVSWLLSVELIRPNGHTLDWIPSVNVETTHRLCAKCVQGSTSLALVRGHWSVLAARPSILLIKPTVLAVCPCHFRVNMTKWSLRADLLRLGCKSIRRIQTHLLNQYLEQLTHRWAHHTLDPEFWKLQQDARRWRCEQLEPCYKSTVLRYLIDGKLVDSLPVDHTEADLILMPGGQTIS